ncbi:MAG TPA: MBL fold metallo-hydrolase [Methylomirabilota bacterium]|nr:MBL fold metallo-hydrolase [Methylomirabilota bacterium]
MSGTTSPPPDSDQVIFVGSGGGRMTTATQARATGGLWIVLDGVRIHVDPGPGALAHVRGRTLGLDPGGLDAIVLTHKHLDHSGDVNAMIEAMTGGGTRPRGLVLAPRDAYDDDPVILQYVRKYARETAVLEAGGRYPIREVTLETPLRLRHPVETYGLRLVGRRHTVALIACTGYFPELEEAFRGDLLILNVVFREPRDDIHLALPDARRLIAAIRPRLAVLTHFGLTMVRARPWELAEALSQETGVRVLAARDRWRLPLDA